MAWLWVLSASEIGVGGWFFLMHHKQVNFGEEGVRGEIGISRGQRLLCRLLYLYMKGLLPQGDPLSSSPSFTIRRGSCTAVRSEACLMEGSPQLPVVGVTFSSQWVKKSRTVKPRSKQWWPSLPHCGSCFHQGRFWGEIYLPLPSGFHGCVTLLGIFYPGPFKTSSWKFPSWRKGTSPSYMFSEQT